MGSNLRAGSAAQVRLGRESFTPQHRFLSEEEAFGVASSSAASTRAAGRA